MTNIDLFSLLNFVFLTPEEKSGKGYWSRKSKAKNKNKNVQK